MVFNIKNKNKKPVLLRHKHITFKMLGFYMFHINILNFIIMYIWWFLGFCDSLIQFQELIEHKLFFITTCKTCSLSCLVQTLVGTFCLYEDFKARFVCNACTERKWALKVYIRQEYWRTGGVKIIYFAHILNQNRILFKMQTI